MKFFTIRAGAKDNADAIALCASKLFEEGCVTSEFGSNCIRREENFPTGLPSAIPVAMPHSEVEGVKEDALCLLILNEPVTFKRMDDDEQEIDAKMVFNLAITDPANHMTVLKNLMQAFYSLDTLKDLYHSSCDEAVLKLEKLLG